MHGTMQSPGAFCELYEEQVRFAMRKIVDGVTDDFLEEGWDKATETVMEFSDFSCIP